MQQNLMQNVYNYYNNFNNNPLNPNGKAEPGECNVKTATSSKLNFSIERILSMPNSASAKNGLLKTCGEYQKSYKKARTSSGFGSGTPIAFTAPIPAGLSSMVSSMYAAKANGGNHQAAKLQINSIKQFASKMSFGGGGGKQQQVSGVKSKNAKKYKCDLCGRGFSRSNTLITHRVS